MVLNNLSWFLLIPGLLGFQQHQFKVVFERMEVASFHTSYYDFAKTHNFKLNRTHAVTIFTSGELMAFGNEPKVEVQAYKMASNEYREFPLRFMFDFCDYAARNEFGIGELFACGNSTACPFKKGVYTSCAWAFNSSKFPPNIPGGSYMLDLKFYYRSVEVLYLQVYCAVKYPECTGCLF